jgi:hypothetical protein
MIRRTLPLCLAAVIFLAGCALTPEEKGKREEVLKNSARTFIGAVISNDFNSVYKLTTGRFSSPQALEEHLKQPWSVGPTLMLGTVASMAWVNDSTAKVKVVWTFQQGTQQSYSAETLLWVWKDGAWKYDGRTLR